MRTLTLLFPGVDETFSFWVADTNSSEGEYVLETCTVVKPCP